MQTGLTGKTVYYSSLSSLYIIVKIPPFLLVTAISHIRDGLNWSSCWIVVSGTSSYSVRANMANYELLVPNFTLNSTMDRQLNSNYNFLNFQNYQL